MITAAHYLLFYFWGSSIMENLKEINPDEPDDLTKRLFYGFMVSNFLAEACGIDVLEE